MLTLNNISPAEGSRHRKKRVGRGKGSGWGERAGRGDKGQKARKSGNVRPGFEGGQTPLYRRLPKRGFTNALRRSLAVVNVADLEKYGLSEITLASLKEAKRLKGRHERLAVLANGELTKPMTVKAHRVSAKAKEKIEKAGGKVEILPIPTMNGEKKKKRAKKD